MAEAVAEAVVEGAAGDAKNGASVPEARMSMPVQCGCSATMQDQFEPQVAMPWPRL